MALRKESAKSAETKTADETPPAEDKLEANETPPAEDKPPVVEEEASKEVGKMILVRNKARFDYVQPSTGIKIYVNSSKPTKVLDDCWVEQFVDAGLLELA